MAPSSSETPNPPIPEDDCATRRTPRASNAPPVALPAVLPAVLWFLLIMVLLSLPGESFPTVAIWKPDKIAHVLLFGMQAVLLWIALVLPTPREPLRISPFLFSGLVTTVFGVASEGYQAAFTTRMADPYDVIANVLGVVLLLSLVRLIGTQRILAVARHLLRYDR